MSPLYPPSWFDRVKSRVEKLPLPYWVTYLIVGVIALLLEAVPRWQLGILPQGTITPTMIVFAAGIAFIPSLMHYFDHVAVSALRQFRPALNADDEQYRELEYKLTTLPASPTWRWTLLAAVGAPLAFILLSPPYASTFVGGPALIALQYMYAALSWAFGGLGIYHTVHQLRHVSLIYNHFASVDLYQSSALYAFSALTARTAMALPLINISWWVAEPRYFRDPLSLAVGITIFSLGALAFVLPLWGVHKRLSQQKGHALDQIGKHLASIAEELHRRLDARDLDAVDNLNKALSSLETEQRMIERIPTFPWQSDTLRTVITALLFPIILFALQFAIQTMVRP